MPDDFSDEMLADRIKALLEERAGAAAGDEARQASIDGELARLGHNATPPAKRAQKRVAKTGDKRA